MERISLPGSLLLGAVVMAVVILGSPVARAGDIGFHNDRVHLALSATSGYRVGELDFNIAGDESGQNPDIRSELEFEDIEIFEFGFDLNLLVDRVDIRGSYRFGEIVDGKSIDSDYTRNGRGGLESRSETDIRDDSITDLSVGVGYQFPFFSDRLTLTPLAGASYSEQNLRLTDGVQTVTTPGRFPELGPFSGLNSTYETEWSTWWLGADVDFMILKNVLVSLQGEYHLGEYDAKADWNLRNDLAHPVSFAHEADAEGVVLQADASYFFAPGWEVGLRYNWQTWTTNAGQSRFFLPGGGSSAQQLNEANWESQGYNLFFRYTF